MVKLLKTLDSLGMKGLDQFVALVWRLTNGQVKRIDIENMCLVGWVAMVIARFLAHPSWFLLLVVPVWLLFVTFISLTQYAQTLRFHSLTPQAINALTAQRRAHPPRIFMRLFLTVFGGFFACYDWFCNGGDWQDSLGVVLITLSVIVEDAFVPTGNPVKRRRRVKLGGLARAEARA